MPRNNLIQFRREGYTVWNAATSVELEDGEPAVLLGNAIFVGSEGGSSHNITLDRQFMIGQDGHDEWLDYVPMSAMYYGTIEAPEGWLGTVHFAANVGHTSLSLPANDSVITPDTPVDGLIATIPSFVQIARTLPGASRSFRWPVYDASTDALAGVIRLVGNELIVDDYASLTDPFWFPPLTFPNGFMVNPA